MSNPRELGVADLSAIARERLREMNDYIEALLDELSDSETVEEAWSYVEAIDTASDTIYLATQPNVEPAST